MGRWGKGIYQSDSALDYFSTISDFIERELAYWFAPEHVSERASWVSDAIRPVELFLLFAHHPVASIVFDEEKAVERWRETFLKVWDGEWEPDQHSHSELDDYAYRQQHRPAIVALFDQLAAIAHFWTRINENNRSLELPPLPNGYQLPYFSKHPGWLVDRLVKDIIYYLSDEMRPDALGFFRVHEDLPVAIDILGLLCSSYKTNPIVNAEGIRKWRATTLKIINETKEDYEIADQSEHYANIMAAFDQLEEVAQKYPPDEW